MHFQYNSAKGIKLFTKKNAIPFNKYRNITSLPSVRKSNPVSQYSGHVPLVDKKTQATSHRAIKQLTTTDISFFHLELYLSSSATSEVTQVVKTISSVLQLLVGPALTHPSHNTVVQIE